MGNKIRKNNNSDNSDGGSKKPKRGWKAQQRIVCFDSQSNGGVDDSELLHIQGLVRCKSCESTYPRDLDKCPHRVCNANT
jgi:hypothetical protein